MMNKMLLEQGGIVFIIHPNTYRNHQGEEVFAGAVKFSVLVPESSGDTYTIPAKSLELYLQKPIIEEFVKLFTSALALYPKEGA